MPGRRGSFIGTLARPHGVSGELRMNINPTFAESIEPGIPLFVEIDGQRVPFFIEQLTITGDDTGILKLSYIDSLEEARKFTGRKLFISPDEGDTSFEEGSLYELTGYTLTDEKAGVLGVIHGVIDSTMNPLFEVKVGEEIHLAPAAAEVIQKVDRKKRIVITRLPDGIPGLTEQQEGPL